MSKYQIETGIEGFIERWLERTWNVDDFVPANVVWDAMLHSAGRDAAARRVWGMNRLEAFEELRDILDLPRQRMRYYRPTKRVAGMPPGFTAPCYERLRLSDYASEAMDTPLLVRPRRPRTSNHELARVYR